MKKKLVSILICVVLMLSIGVVAYAAGTNFTLKYYPGTNDPSVTGYNRMVTMCVTGTPMQVDGRMPQREGYEFLGWTLDYSTAETYTLHYQVAGDPTYGKPGDVTEPYDVTVPAGGSVTLAGALATAWKTSDGSDLPTTASYTVKYIVDGEAAPFDQKVVPDQPVGSTVTEPAGEFEGYKLIDPASTPQSIDIRQNAAGVWTFTGWCSDEECTIRITELTNVTADTTVYGKWTYSETNNPNEIKFFYEKLCRYFVYYVDHYKYYIQHLTLEESTIHPYNMGFAEKDSYVEDEHPVPVDGYMAPAWKWLEITGDGVCLIYAYHPMY